MASPLDVAKLPDLFETIVTADPVSALLVAVGAALIAVSLGAFGLLTLGALVDLLTPETIGRQPPRAD